MFPLPGAEGSHNRQVYRLSVLESTLTLQKSTLAAIAGVSFRFRLVDTSTGTDMGLASTATVSEGVTCLPF